MFESRSYCILAYIQVEEYLQRSKNFVESLLRFNILKCLASASDLHPKGKICGRWRNVELTLSYYIFQNFNILRYARIVSIKGKKDVMIIPVITEDVGWVDIANKIKKFVDKANSNIIYRSTDQRICNDSQVKEIKRWFLENVEMLQ